MQSSAGAQGANPECFKQTKTRLKERSSLTVAQYLNNRDIFNGEPNLKNQPRQETKRTKFENSP
eukprot:833827-Amphidinium_carterae.1